MKHFARTGAGKALLILLFLLCLTLTAGCVLGVLVMVDGGIYDKTAAEIQEETRDAAVFRQLREVVIPLLMTEGPEVSEAELGAGIYAEIYDPAGRLTAKGTGPARTEGDGIRTYELTFYAAENGEMTELDPYTPGDWRCRAMVDEAVFFDAALRPDEQLAGFLYRVRYTVYPVGAAGALCTVLLFAALMCAAGKRPGTEEPVEGPFVRVPYELVLGCGGAMIVFLCAILADVGDFFVYELHLHPAWAILPTAVPVVLIFVGLSMSFAARVKGRTLVRYSITGWVLRSLRKLIKAVLHGAAAAAGGLWRICVGIPAVWKTAGAVALLTLAELAALAGTGSEDVFGFWFLEKLVLVPAVLWMALNMNRLKKAGERMAAGDLDHRVDTKGMYPQLKTHGENLNRISAGMGRAVEQQLRSERLKTELITNVSHDIKTPLTSIVNYTGLICREDCDNPRITEYARVLLRQSEKLKRLIEDLLEASKASTGNLEVNPVPCDAAVFLTQADGEYQDKLEAAGLSLVTRISGGECRIMADGRRMWRVFDNLMSNICKYAQPGTRVYLTLTREEGAAVFTFRNTSREPLDISPEELMERFVRGDSARNTEGNGLGLSIAESLTKLQGGSFQLQVDGDLFKVILRFPVLEA